MKDLTKLFLISFFGYVLGASDVWAQSIKVAVASNLLIPFQQIEAQFESKYPYQIEVIPGASGTLTSQILNGAPYEIFVSADDKYIEEVVNAGRVYGGPYTICFGSVYLWVKDDVAGNDIVAILQQGNIKSVALAHPDLAPYGRIARDWLEVKQLGLLIQPKVVYGNSITQVNQYITTGAVDAAFTSNSLKFSDRRLPGRFFKIDEIWIDPVPQTMVMIKTDGPGMFVATLFKDFLMGREARKIFESLGYETPVAE